MDVSVVLPCLNEEEGIGICLDKINEVFLREGILGEIVVVDNGSTDKSAQIVRNRNEENIKLIYEKRKGYGRAYRTGFENVCGRIVFLGDADNSYDFYEIPKFLEKLKEKDFVVGNRKKVKKGAMPFLHRYVGRPIFYFLMRGLFHLKISDSHCGFGGIKKEKLDKLDLKSEGMEFASEILIKSKKSELRIGEIDIIYSCRKGKSKLRTVRDGLRHFRLIFSEYLGLS